MFSTETFLDKYLELCDLLTVLTFFQRHGMGKNINLLYLLREIMKSCTSLSQLITRQ